MKVAIYTRVSSSDQSTEMQIRVLREYCQARGFTIYREYTDHGISGTKCSRPSLDELLNDTRKKLFDVVLVYRFDRFARSSKQLITSLEEFNHLGIDFISYQENIDTSSPLGKAIFTIVSAMAELERNIIVERIKTGLYNAKKNGKQLGRPKAQLDLNQARALKQEGYSIRSIAQKMNISKSTVAKYLSVKLSKLAA